MGYAHSVEPNASTYCTGMYIGEHRIRVINKDKLMVGCQEVTRKQLETLLAVLDSLTHNA